MAFQGILCFIPPCFACGSRSPPSPASIFLAGDFLYTNFCVQARVKPPPCGLCAGFRLNRRSWRRSERQRRVPVPHSRTLEDETSLTAEPGQPDDGGDRRAKAREGAHGAASGARTAGGREADRRDSGDGRARAPRATDFGQRPKDAGGCAPAPAKITARVRPPKGEARRGEGGSAPWARRGKGNDPTRNRAQRPAPPPTKRRNSRQRQRPEARRGRETGREAGRQPAEGTQNRARPAAKPPRPTTERRPAGAEAAPPRPTPQHGANHASGRRNGGETDGDGAGRAETGRESQAAAPKPPAQKKSRTERHSTRATDAEAANHGGHGRQHARTPGGGTLRERADGQRAESATGQRQEGGRARESPDKAAEGSGRSGGAPTAQPNAESSANAESRPPDRGPPLRPL